MITVMVGLQGSGKSTKAKELAKFRQATVLSSDEIRKENPDWDNEKVFKHLYAKMIELVDDGKSVIIDATNTTIKARKPIFEALKKAKIGTNIEAYIMTTPVTECKKRVEERNKDKNSHFVPLEVIDKYLHSFEIPFYEEGFDTILFDGFIGDIEGSISEFISVFEKMVGFDQKNKHHKHNLNKHCVAVADELENRGIKDMESEALFHDIGKLFTQTFKDGDPNAHYYNHASVGTYYLLSHLGVLPNGDRASIKEIANTLFYINYHMRPFEWNTEKARNKWRGIFGEEKYNNLLIFNECDKAGC